MYVSMWSDPDVGDSGDDYAGCDTVLSVSFAYNGKGQMRFTVGLPHLLLSTFSRVH